MQSGPTGGSGCSDGRTHVPYKVLDNEELNWADTTTDKKSYAKMLEAACNAMERDGYTLVSVIHGDMDSMNPHTFVFHKPEDS